MQLNFTLFLLILTFCSCTKEIKKSTELDERLTELVDKSGLVGFSTIIIDNDKIKYQNSFGYSDLVKKLKYDNDTKQPIASISKTFLGLSIMKAIEQGHFTLETPINDILPFKVINPNHKDKPILVRHLATHTSGLLDVDQTYYNNHFILKGEDLTNVLVDTLKRFGFQTGKDVTPLGDFLKNYYAVGGSDYSTANFDTKDIGTSYNYSNIASSLAAYLIEVKSGMSYKEYTKKYIFEPLGMSRTTWNDEKTTDNTSTLYWSKTQVLPRINTSSYPDGSLSTTNNDMAKYMLELMAAFNEKNSNKILTNESYKQLFKKQYADNKLPLNYDPKENNAGIFWVYFTNGRMGHTGGDIGVLSIMAFDPKTKKAFYVMTNTDVDNIEDNVALVKQITPMLDAIKEFEKN